MSDTSSHDPFFAAVSRVVEERCRSLLKVLWCQERFPDYVVSRLYRDGPIACRTVWRLFRTLKENVAASVYADCLQFEGNQGDDEDDDEDEGCDASEDIKLTILRVPAEFVDRRGD